MIAAKKPMLDIVHDLERLNMQQRDDAEFMQQLKDVIIQVKKDLGNRPK
jgi:hypothetical protein